MDHKFTIHHKIESQRKKTLQPKACTLYANRQAKDINSLTTQQKYYKKKEL